MYLLFYNNQKSFLSSFLSTSCFISSGSQKEFYTPMCVNNCFSAQQLWLVAMYTIYEHKYNPWIRPCSIRTIHKYSQTEEATSRPEHSVSSVRSGAPQCSSFEQTQAFSSKERHLQNGRRSRRSSLRIRRPPLPLFRAFRLAIYEQEIAFRRKGYSKPLEANWRIIREIVAT